MMMMTTIQVRIEELQMRALLGSQSQRWREELTICTKETSILLNQLLKKMRKSISKRTQFQRKKN